MDTTTLSETELMVLASAYPSLPAEYFAYLRNVGSGETKSGHMIYGGPVPQPKTSTAPASFAQTSCF